LEERPGDEAGGGFAALGLNRELVAAVAALGYEEPTPIQREAIPPLLEGRDVLGQAATGTGKTAAFALPLLQRIGVSGQDRPPIRALILVPTRELAMQVAEAVHTYGRTLNTRVLPIYGGQSMQQQLRALGRGVDVVVATPGRALDHIRRGTLDLAAAQTVVLDEADEMLDMGFAEDLDAILGTLPAERQSALFSATMAPRILAIAKRHLRNPVRVTIARETQAAGETPRVREVAYIVQRRDKVAALARVLDMEDPTSAIVFCRTRTEVDDLTETLGARGYRAERASPTCSSRPTSRHAGWTSSTSRTSSTSTCPRRPTPTRTASGARGAPAARASRSRSPSRASIACCFRFNSSPNARSRSSRCRRCTTCARIVWS
jgi:ATP-dependent RNA helicase DeaD